ncbi:MAG: M15 family metallopeptidase [Pseudomonadota bacterium]
MSAPLQSATIALFAACLGAVGGAWLAGQRGGEGLDHAKLSVLEQRIAQQTDLIEEMQIEIEGLKSARAQLGALANPLEGLDQALPDGDLPPLLEDRENSFGRYAELMLLSARRHINSGLKPISQSRLIEVFGRPAESLTQDCAPPTSPRLVAALTTRDVGPFRARLIRPAVDSLERIFAKLKADEPGLYATLRTYGGLCARLIRGSSERISRHAFGVALDVSVGGTLDRMGDGTTQFGLILLAEHFQAEGWVWGAAFRREDSMHFEVSADLFEKWLAEGAI